MTTRDQLDRASKRHPFGEFSIDAAARDEIDQLQARNAVLREALTEIATGRNAAGEKVDFYADIARAALNTGGTDA